MKKAISLAMALLAIITLFTSCGGGGGEETTTSAETTTLAATTLATGDTTVPVPGTGDTTTAVSATGTATTVPGTGTATTAAPTTVASNNFGAPVGGTVEQIVQYYNTKANAIKQEKNFSVKRVQDQSIKFDEPALVAAVFNALLKDLTKVSTSDEVFANGVGTKKEGNTPAKYFTVKDKDYVSQLTANGVKSAECKVEGDKVVITILLNEETCNAKVVPPIYGSCINNITEDIINVKEAKISDDAQATYSAGSMKLTVDGASGKATQLITHAEGKIKGNVEAGTITYLPTVKNAVVSGKFTETFDMTY